MRTRTRSTLAAFTALSMLAPTAAFAADSTTSDATTSDAPAPTAERIAPPASVAVLGDSISAGTGSTGSGQGGFPGAERPRNSWATGDWPTLNSVYQRVAALPGNTAQSFNLSENGRRSQHILQQVQGSPTDIDYILVQIGGNDLCRPTVAEMTPTAEYRANIDAALDWISVNRPDALVQLNAVPDIYRLWEIRRSNFFAVLFWASGLIPCQSLLSSPTSTSAANMARRAQVRERGLEYNDQLREACEEHVRCRYDDDATWLFSNDPATFVNGDISTEDHFHPSYQGQQKLAGVSWEAGFDFTDLLAPSVSVDTDWYVGGVDVEVTALDDEGVSGLEYREHAADGSVGGWQQVVGDRAELTFDTSGARYLEVRAIDVNGNVSASTVQQVIDDTDPTVDLQFPIDGGEVLLNEELTVAFSCDDDLSGVASCVGTQDDGDTLDTSTVGPKTFTVDATDAAGNTSSTSVSYRVVYAFAAAADRVDTASIEIQRNALLPVRVSVADVGGTVVAGLSPTLTLVAADGSRTAAGSLAYDPIQDRYAAEVSLRTLRVTPGTYDLVAGLEDGTERTVVSLVVR